MFLTILIPGLAHFLLHSNLSANIPPSPRTSPQSFCSEHLEDDSPLSPENQYIQLLEALVTLLPPEQTTELFSTLLRSHEPYNPVTISDLRVIPLSRFFEKLLEGDLDWTLIKERVQERHGQFLQNTQARDESKSATKEIPPPIFHRPGIEINFGTPLNPNDTFDHKFRPWRSPRWLTYDQENYFVGVIGSGLHLTNLRTGVSRNLKPGLGTDGFSSATQPIPFELNGRSYLILGVHQKGSRTRNVRIEVYNLQDNVLLDPFKSWDFTYWSFAGDPIRISDSKGGFPRFLFPMSSRLRSQHDDEDQNLRMITHFMEIDLDQERHRLSQRPRRIGRVLQSIATSKDDFLLVKEEDSRYASISYQQMYAFPIYKNKKIQPTLYKDSNGQLKTHHGEIHGPPVIRFRGSTMGIKVIKHPPGGYRRLGLVELPSEKIHSEFDLKGRLGQRTGVQLITHGNELFAAYITDDTPDLGTSTSEDGIFRFHVVPFSRPDAQVSIELPSYDSDSSGFSLVPTQDGFTMIYVDRNTLLRSHHFIRNY